MYGYLTPTFNRGLYIINSISCRTHSCCGCRTNSVVANIMTTVGIAAAVVAAMFPAAGYMFTVTGSILPAKHNSHYFVIPRYCHCNFVCLSVRLSVTLVSHKTKDAQDDALAKHFPSMKAFLCWNHVLQVPGIVLLSQCYSQFCVRNLQLF